MTVTEAYEWVMTAAETLVGKADEQQMKDAGIENLRKALKKVKPRVAKMRKRLDDARALRAKSKIWVPKWME